MFSKSIQTGLLKNVQDGIYRPLGCQEIQGNNRGYNIAGHPACMRPNLPDMKITPPLVTPLIPARALGRWSLLAHAGVLVSASNEVEERWWIPLIPPVTNNTWCNHNFQELRIKSIIPGLHPPVSSSLHTHGGISPLPWVARCQHILPRNT